MATLTFEIWKIDALPDTTNPYLADEEDAESGWYWNDKILEGTCSIDEDILDNPAKLRSYLEKEHGFIPESYSIEFFDFTDFEICSTDDGKPEYAFFTCID